jgi:NADPH:quinone reductase-like Zn-dependent oxidoreductase
MRAAEIPERGAAPRAADVAEPAAPGPGEALVRLRAGAINPVDMAIAAGRFYRPVPDPPYVPGAEAVVEVVAGARLAAGTRAWCMVTDGCLAERFVVDEAFLHPVPDGVGDELAVALGIAGMAGWMPVAERGGLRASERVLVLGANGTVGRVALWAARSRAAGRVVAVVREGSAEAVAGLADAVVTVGGDDLTERMREALGGGADLVVDPVWGAPALAAIRAMAPRGRLVQVGNSAGPVMELPAGPLRGGRLDLRGFSLYVEEPEDLSRAYAELCEAAAASPPDIAIESYQLEDVGAAWERQRAGGSRAKVVVIP